MREKGIRVRVKVTKNKVAPPYKIGVFDIEVREGNQQGSKPIGRRRGA